MVYRGVPDSSVDKESTCNAGDPGSIPGSGRSTGEGIGYPLQYSWASRVIQLVKNLPAMWETWVWYLGWEDPPEKGKATHCSILAWRIPWTAWSCKESDVTEWLSLHFHTGIYMYLLKWNADTWKLFFYANWVWLVRRKRLELDTDSY